MIFCNEPRMVQGEISLIKGQHYTAEDLELGYKNKKKHAEYLCSGLVFLHQCIFQFQLFKCSFPVKEYFIVSFYHSLSYYQLQSLQVLHLSQLFLLEQQWTWSLWNRIFEYFEHMPWRGTPASNERFNILYLTVFYSEFQSIFSFHSFSSFYQ